MESTLRGARRRPVVPTWAHSRQEFTLAARGVAVYGWHVAAYHALRTPWYVLRLTLKLRAAPPG